MIIDDARGPSLPAETDKALVERLIRPPRTNGAYKYSSEAGSLLGFASAFAYSDASTLCTELDRTWLPGNLCHQIHISVPAMLVEATAFFIRSACGRLGILCFRGTEPTSIITWLANATTQRSQFLTLGPVHGGFLRNVGAIWSPICDELNRSLVTTTYVNTQFMELDYAAGGTFRKWHGLLGQLAPPSGGDHAVLAGPAGDGDGERKAPTDAFAPIRAKRSSNDRRLELQGLEALYITGHSLGAAMAALAAGIICCQPIERFQRLLRGVYTFGQPMIGDATVANECQRTFGDMVFRHVYGNDIVPRLPPSVLGKFRHFGVEYSSGDDGWTLCEAKRGQALDLLFSNTIGIASWAFQQIPVLEKVRLPYSWNDHSPVNYLRTFRGQASPPSGTDYTQFFY
jgi:hypothetical protein